MAQAVPARKGLNHRQWEAIAGYLFIMPWIIGFLGLTLGPIIASLYFSFTNYQLV